ACLLTGSFDLLNDAVKMGADLLVNDDDIGSGMGKGFDVVLRVGNHQMGFKRKGGGAAYRFHNYWPHCDIGHKMAVHHVNLDTLSAAYFGLAYLFAQACQVGGQYRRNDSDHI